MKRLFTMLIMAVIAMFPPLSNVYAQAGAGWTLNINADKPSPVTAGSDIEFTARINNSDNYPTPATTVDFILPESSIFNGITGLNGCAPLPDAGELLTQDFKITCDVPELDPGESIEAQFNIAPQKEDVINISGTVEGNGASQDRTITVQKGADLELELAFATNEVKGGGTAEFKAVITNHGPYESDGGIFSFPIPAGLTINTPLPAGCSVAGNDMVCSFGQGIGAGDKIELSFSGQVLVGNASDIVIGGKVVSDKPLDPNVSNNQATANIKVLAGTDVSLSKARSPQGLILTGALVDFTLTAQFAGDEPAQATITDTLPDNYDFKEFSVPAGSGWSCNIIGREITCNYTKTTGSAYKAPIIIKTVAALETPDGEQVVNTASIGSTNEDPEYNNNNTASDGGASIVKPIIDLVAHKSGPQYGLVAVGNEYPYSLNTSNAGNANFFGRLEIIDHLPEGLTVKSIAAPSGWTCSPATDVVGPQDITCYTDQYTEANPLRPGAATPPIVLTAKITKAGNFSNGMTVAFENWDKGADGEPGNNTTYVGGKAGEGPTLSDLAIKKTIASASATVNAGEEIEFAIEIINKGDSTATGIVVDDRLNGIVAGADGEFPIAIIPVVTAGVATGISCEAPPSGAYYIDLKCTIQSLPVCTSGSDCPVIKVKVRPGAEGLKTNTAHVFSTEVPDPILSNNDSSVNYTVEPKTDVTVVKASASQQSGAAAGQNVTYTITASVPRNGLSGADNVIVTDTLPSGVYFVSAKSSVGTGICSVTPAANSLVASGNDILECDLGRVENGSQQTVTVVVKPTTAQVGATIINNVSVKTDTPETNTDNNTASVPVKITEPSLDLLITKTDTVDGTQYDPVEKNNDTIYLITATNAGPSDAYNVKITDVLPLGGFHSPVLVDVPAGLTCGLVGTSTTQAGGEIICTMPVLQAGKDVQFKVRMTSFERGTYANTVKIASDETAYERSDKNNTDSETTTVRVRSDISVVKTPSSATVDLREKFNWDIVITSLIGAGLEVAENVTLADTLPEGMELTALPLIISGNPSASCTGTIGQRQINCTLGDMEPGMSVTVRLETKITAMTAQSASNTATVKTDSFDNVPENNTSTGSVTTVLGGSISGQIFKDFNENTQKDANDGGVGSVTVTLTGTALHDDEKITKTLKTNADGTYNFTDVPPGTYQVSYSQVPVAIKHIAGVAKPGTSSVGASTASDKVTIDSIVIEKEFASVSNDFTLIPLPSIGLSKVAGTPVNNGDGTYSVDYQLTVKNLSLEPVQNVVLTDVLNASSQNFGTYSSETLVSPGHYRVTGVAINGGAPTINNQFNGATDTVIISSATIAPDAAVSVTVSVLVNPVKPWIANPLVLTNQAKVAADGQYSGKTNISDLSDNRSGGEGHPDWNVPTTVNLVPESKIILEKSATFSKAGTVAAAGDRIDYGFKVTNNGKTPLFNVTIEDLLPNLVWDENTPITELGIGDSNDTAFVAHYIITQTDIDNGSITNTATTTGKWGDIGGQPQNVNSSDTEKVDDLGQPALTLLKELKASSVQNPSEVGDRITYTFTVTNTGNMTLRNVTITDALAGVTESTTDAFKIGVLEPNETKEVEAYYLLKQEDIDNGQVVNSAIASGLSGPGAGKPIETDPSDVTVPTFSDAKLTLVKALSSAVPAPAYAGDMLEWTVIATNDGNVTLHNVVVTDPLKDAVVTPASVATLAPGENFTFTVKAPIQQQHINNGMVENTATAEFENPAKPNDDQDPVESNKVETPLAHQPAISLEKEANIDALSQPAKVDDVIIYSFTIRNIGNVPLDGIVLTDELDGFELDAADVEKLRTLTLQPVNAAKDNEAEVEVIVYGRYKLKASDVDAGKLENSADVAGTPTYGDDKTPVTDDSSTDTDFERQPSIKLIKTITETVFSTPVQAGDTITYAFAIHNTGNVTLDHIRIEELVADVQVINITGWSGPLEAGGINDTAFTATYTKSL